MSEYQQVMQTTQAADFSPLYLVVGTEQYFINQLKNQWINQVLSAEDLEMNFIQLDLTEQTIDDLLFEATSYPFFGDKKLIFAENADFLTSQKKYALTDTEQKELFEYIKSPSDFAIIVFFAPYDKIDKRKKVSKQFTQQATVIDVSAPNPNDAERLFKKLMNESNYHLTPDAFTLFWQLVGGNLSKAMNEFQKLKMYQGTEVEITKETVSALVPKNLEHNIFELNNLVVSGQIQQAVAFYQDLLLRKEEPIKINALLMSEFRLLLQVKLLQDQNFSNQQISSQLKVHWYRVKLAAQKVRRFTTQQLAQALELLIDTDFQMKTGQIDHELSVELFLLKLKDILFIQ